MAAHALSATAAADAAPVERAPARALAGWMLFDWAAQPFYTLVLTFLFAPYFANVVIGDVTRGQAIWGYAAATAGIIIAIGSPLLGALADGRGRRKPYVVLFAVILACGMASLWFARPQPDTMTLAFVLIAFVVATVAAEFASVFSNAIMPTLAPRDELGRLSGLAWGVGYMGGLVSLALMAGLIVTSPATGKTLFGLDPLLTLDVASREGDRLVGPFSALWLLVFIIPFILFVPDIKTRRESPQRSALAELASTLRELPGHRDLMLFLIARMIYVDGLSAIFAFGGIYGSAVFGWGAFELGLFGIVLTLTGAIGSVLGGVFDDRIGAKWVIIASLIILLISAVGILSVSREHVFFTLPVTPKATGSGPFTSPGEQVFLAFAMAVGFVAASVQAASRSLLARLAPLEKMTQFFGLFAFSGKVTAFLAPLLVATVTAWSGSQRAGMAVIAGFLVTGLLLMLPVRERRS